MSNQSNYNIIFYFIFFLCRDVLFSAKLQAVIKGRVWGQRGDGDLQFFGPWGAVLTSMGTMWVADGSNHRLCLLR
jgi:hypothetical protein